MMDCPQCGKPLLRGKPYCMYCGCRAADAELPGDAETDALFSGEPEKLSRSVLLARLIPLFVLAGMLLAAGGSYAYVRHFQAKSLAAMRAYDFRAADAALSRIPASEYLYSAERIYVDAGLLMENGRYDLASAAFAALGSYEDAALCVSEAQYRKASALLTEGKYAEAAECYRALGDFRDSAAQAQDAAFAHAEALMESGDPAGALSILKDLRAAGYSRAELGIQTLYSNVYAQAETLYARSAFDAAQKALLLLDGYAESADYLALIAFRQGQYAGSAADQVAATLVPLIGFADADALLMLDTETACTFLAGRWTSGAESLQVSSSPDGGWGITCTLPWSASGTFRVSNGSLLVAGRTGEETPVFRFAVRSADCITVYAAASETAYVFYKES